MFDFNFFSIRRTGFLCLLSCLVSLSGADARLSWLQGEAQRVDSLRSQSLQTGSRLQEGQTLRVSSGSRAVLEFSEDHHVRLIGPATLKVQMASSDGRQNRLSLMAGRIWCSIRSLVQGELFEVQTATATAGVRGTEFGVEFDALEKTIQTHVAEGTVELTNLDGEIQRLTEGMVSNITSDTMGMVQNQLEAVGVYRDFASVPLDSSKEAAEQSLRLMQDLDLKLNQLEKDLEKMGQDIENQVEESLRGVLPGLQNSDDDSDSQGSVFEEGWSPFGD